MTTKKMQDPSPPEGYRLAGWLYFNDDGVGPFYSEWEQDSYLNCWPIFEREPSDKHRCKCRGMAYGVCSQCEILEQGARL